MNLREYVHWFAVRELLLVQGNAPRGNRARDAWVNRFHLAN